MAQQRETPFWDRKLRDARPLNALRREVLEGARDRMAAQYYAKYFEKNRFRPIVQLAMLAGGLGYAVHYYAVGRHYHKTRKYH